MKAYLNVLTNEVEAQRIRREATRRAHAEAASVAAREKLVPLDDRLARLLSTIPVEVQREGPSITALQAQLRARGRGHTRCHVGELGEALRRRGWARVRRWDGGTSGFQALWYPKLPTADANYPSTN